MKTIVFSIITCSVILAALQAPPVFADEQEKESIFPGNKERHLREAAKYRFEFDNDVLFDSDNQFTNGWSFQVHTPVADSWNTMEGPDELFKKIGAWLPSLTAEGLKYRMSLSIGQLMEPQDDIENPSLITEDVTYAGVSTIKSIWIGYTNNACRGLETICGVLERP